MSATRKYLVTKHFINFVKALPNYLTKGPLEMAHHVVCNLDYYNQLASGNTKNNVKCDGELCNLEKGDCGEDCEADDCTFTAETKRSSDTQGFSSNPAHVLSKRGEQKNWYFACTNPDGTTSSARYRTMAVSMSKMFFSRHTKLMETINTPSQMFIDDPILDRAYDVLNSRDCLVVSLYRTRVPDYGQGLSPDPFDVEHVFDRSLLRDFFEDAGNGRLPSGAQITVGPLRCTFFRQVMTQPVLNITPQLGGNNLPIPMERISWWIGGTAHPDNFVLLSASLNRLKWRILNFRRVDPWSEADTVNGGQGMQTLRADFGHPERALLRIRSVLRIFDYFHQVQPQQNNILNGIRDQIELAETWNNAQANQPQVDAVLWWDRWIRDLYAGATSYARAWVFRQIRLMREDWDVDGNGPSGDPQHRLQVLQVLAVYEAYAEDMYIDVSGLD